MAVKFALVFAPTDLYDFLTETISMVKDAEIVGFFEDISTLCLERNLQTVDNLVVVTLIPLTGNVSQMILQIRTFFPNARFAIAVNNLSANLPNSSERLFFFKIPYSPRRITQVIRQISASIPETRVCGRMLEIRTFGKFEMLLDGSVHLDLFNSDKISEIFLFLLSNFNSPISIDYIVSIIFPNSETPVRHRFFVYDALVQISDIISEHLFEWLSISCEGDFVRLNIGRYVCDFVDFFSVLGDDFLSADFDSLQSPKEVCRIEILFESYCGDFLREFDYGWIHPFAQKAQAIFGKIAHDLVLHYDFIDSSQVTYLLERYISATNDFDLNIVERLFENYIADGNDSKFIELFRVVDHSKFNKRIANHYIKIVN